ncbi:MAG: 5-formyltetrahydrofolate cyclo-ligase [Spirochaetaceae bacterium]|jgi:5-formyltetrahydrofolate cyclo-ligase|nr:5-formyltetrahydrofolate cyclo-ligase [Spirochaetaceae bacterium]
MISKPALRKEIKGRLQAFPVQKFRDEGMSAAERIRGLPVWSLCETALLFLNDKLEIHTDPLLETAFSDKKKVFVPKTVDKEHIRFYRIYSPAGPWRYGAFDIREPETDRPEDELKPADFPVLIIVPGVAFDRDRNRMGHGKGYYDRFFASLDERGLGYTMLGLCMDAQIVPEIPTEVWDKKMDALCTGSEYIG